MPCVKTIAMALQNNSPLLARYCWLFSQSINKQRERGFFMDKNDRLRITEKVIKMLVKEKATSSDAIRILEDAINNIHAFGNDRLCPLTIQDFAELGYTEKDTGCGECDSCLAGYGTEYCTTRKENQNNE
jgi:hypothetical protein